MSEMVLEQLEQIEETNGVWTFALDVSHLITEDDEPVGNLFSAKQQRLLVEPLYSSWGAERPFLADANVGIFSAIQLPPIVPDMFLSLDVTPAEDWWAKEHRSYFLWEFGKPPDLAVEIVSNLKGDELGRKLRRYAQMGVSYYAVFDPQGLLMDEPLRLYELYAGEYQIRSDNQLPRLGLALGIWEGVFEQKEGEWLRWYDLDGRLIPTGAERAEQERLRVERLAAQLRALGVEPDL